MNDPEQWTESETEYLVQNGDGETLERFFHLDSARKFARRTDEAVAIEAQQTRSRIAWLQWSDGGQ